MARLVFDMQVAGPNNAHGGTCVDVCSEKTNQIFNLQRCSAGQRRQLHIKGRVEVTEMQVD